MPLLCAFFVLVLSTTTANAECAWVVWFKGLSAEQRSTQCEGAHQKTRDWVKTMQSAPGTFMTGSYVCCPGTVDPRGPKGAH